MNNNPYLGSSLDDLLEEDGILAEVNACAKRAYGIALKRVHDWQIKQQEEVSITEHEIEVWNLKQNLSWQIEQAMNEKELTKNELEHRMNVSENHS